MPDEPVPGPPTPPPYGQGPGYLTPQQIEDLEAALAGDPAAEKLREMTVEQATQTGGPTLQLLQLIHGYYFGQPYAFTFEQCAATLNRPVSDLMNLYQQLMDQVRPLWMATTEYQAWKASPDYRGSAADEDPGDGTPGDDATPPSLRGE
jgi:hypothetical protein